MTPEQRAELRRLCDAPSHAESIRAYKFRFDRECRKQANINEHGLAEWSGVLFGLNQAIDIAEKDERISIGALLDYVETLEVEIERLKKLHEPKADTYACQRCGRRDGLDAVIPNQHWATITEGNLLTVEVVGGKWNLLCLWCIDELCKQHEIECSASLHFCGATVSGASDSDVNRAMALLAECQPIVRATGHTAECMDAWDDRPGLQVCTCHISPLRCRIAAILKERPDDA